MSYTHNDHQTARDDIAELQEKVSEGRREFFKQVGQGAVATAVATTAMHMGVRPYMKPTVSDAVADSMPTGGWRNLFSLKPNYLYMNVGTTGSTPTQVLDKYEDWYYEVAWKCEAYKSTVDYCIDVAPSFGCKPTEFVMSFTTTDGMMKAMQGQVWAEGDKIITTNMEHSGGLGPMYAQVNRYGVVAPEIDLVWVNKDTGAVISTDPDTTPSDPDAIPAALSSEMILTPTGIRKNYNEMLGFPLPDQIPAGEHPDDYFYRTNIGPEMSKAVRAAGGRVRAMMLSSPPYLTGVRFPEKQMCAYTAPRKIWSTIDGAHLTGMINIDFHAMGVDFFAGSGHKWQCGPGQTGIAYFRNGAGEGDRTWTLNDNYGVTRTGTSPAYASGDAPMPPYFPWSDSFRMSMYTDAANTQRRMLVSGYRNADQNVSGMIQSIGNNSIPINRALYECMKLWNTIGRQNIDDYVCTLAQYLRFLTASNASLNGNGGLGAALYAHVAEFRKNNVSGNSLKWSDVWHPVADRNNFPVYARCGLTGWNPHYLAGQGPDFDRPLTVAARQAQASSASSILTYLNAQHGIYTRNTSCPHMMRFQNPAAGVNSTTVYAANASADFGTQNHSTPFRVSTHLFHDTADVETFNNVWTSDATLRAMLQMAV